MVWFDIAFYAMLWVTLEGYALDVASDAVVHVLYFVIKDRWRERKNREQNLCIRLHAK